MTFGADLEFYERVLRRHFGVCRNQIVLADGEQLDRTVAAVAAAGTLRHLNRSWIAGPIRIPHAAHAKLILLAAPDSAVLLVGSGNLRIGGYAGAGECFTPYRWSADGPSDVTPFTAVRSLTDGLGDRGHLDAVTRDRLKIFWGAYDWWHEEPVADGPVRHNLKIPLGDQFCALIGGEHVEELVVVAPFHDSKCAALRRLLDTIKPRRVRVLVQPRQSSVDPKQLAAVMQRHNGGVFAIEAAGDYVGTYLHAKLFLARTKQRAVCLTGSANCSMVALWDRHPDANIEIGNFATGEPHAFDHMFENDVVTISGPFDPSTLNVSFLGDADKDDLHPAIRVENLRWDSPTLTGTIHAEINDSSEVTIEVEGRAVAQTVKLKRNKGITTDFEAHLWDAADIEALDRVAVVTILINSVAAVPTVPCQVARLREQDRRRVDMERLRHAARLELDDPDLEQALAALEEILVGENIARWSHGSSAPPSGEDGGGARIAWEDIDWSTVHRHPRFAAYGVLGGLGAVAGSDLAAYLDALSQAVRELAEPDASPSPHGATSAGAKNQDGTDDDDETDDSSPSSGVEGAEVDDIVDEEVEQPPAKRRQSTAARNLRLIRNFVRRNLHVLEQAEFRKGVGIGVVIPNVIILNWLCWWMATKDEERPGELAEERLRLWRMLWGSGTSQGYLDELDDEQHALVLEAFDDQHFEIVTLASMADLWSYSDYGDETFMGLREVVRKAVCHPCCQVTVQHLAPAARLVNSRPTTSATVDPVSLAEALWDAACEPLGMAEASAAVADAVGTTPKEVTVKEQRVVVDLASNQRLVCEMFVPMAIASGDAEKAFAAWRGVDDRDYYRLKWEGGVALYRTVEKTGWVYTAARDEMVDLGFIAASYPSWRVELDRLYDAAKHAAEAAA